MSRFHRQRSLIRIFMHMTPKITLGLLIASTAAAQIKFETLHPFQAAPIVPIGALVAGPEGNYWGVSTEGGVNGVGTIFKLTPAGVIIPVYSFNCALDGCYPESELVLHPDGRFYGTTTAGGLSGHGTIFAITLSGQLTTICNFPALDRYQRPAPLVVGMDGWLYGSTGGLSITTPGTAFKVSTAGSFVQLHLFSNGAYGGYGADGGFPGPLTKGRDGNFYGLSTSGGQFGSGTFFQLTPTGAFSILYNFANADGNAGSGLVELADGEFYASSTGSNGLPLVFKVTTSGAYAKLRDLPQGTGLTGSAALALGPDGNLYGACPPSVSGSDKGIIFRVTPSGSFTELHDFTGGSDGAATAQRSPAQCESAIFWLHPRRRKLRQRNYLRDRTGR